MGADREKGAGYSVDQQIYSSVWRAVVVPGPTLMLLSVKEPHLGSRGVTILKYASLHSFWLLRPASYPPGKIY